jgi:hypothetical protein
VTGKGLTYDCDCGHVDEMLKNLKEQAKMNF